MNYYYFDNKNKKFGKEKHFQIQINKNGTKFICGKLQKNTCNL